MSVTKLQQEFAQSAALLIQKAKELGFEVTLGEAWRTAQQAEWDEAHHTGVADSVHCDRLAIDLNLFKGDDYLTDSAPYVQLGTWWKTLGPAYRYGGDFKIRDYDHFSITPDGVRA